MASLATPGRGTVSAMHITMVKKRLADGQPCRKCLRAQDLLERRGLWQHIDEVVWAITGEPDSPGWQLAAAHQVERAPFFVVRADDGGETVYESVLIMIRECLSDGPTRAAAPKGDSDGDFDMAASARRLADAPPTDIVRAALDTFGSECAIAFSGAEDVAVIDMAYKTGLSFSVISLDTGRLHPETCEFIERVRSHYGIDIEIYAPDAARVEALVRRKGLFSFLADGHGECCGIRKVDSLERALGGYRAWMTGQRRDQSEATRGSLPVVQADPRFQGARGPLCKFNPLAAWTSAQVWTYIREHGVPYNPLHERGFASIGCAPCTRPILPGQHEREGRWWWEQADTKECGLHVTSAAQDAPGDS